MLLCILGLLAATSQSFAQPDHAFIYYDQNGLKELKAEIGAGRHGQLIRQLRSQANGALKIKPSSVTHKKQLPPSGDPHDYVSLARYWWPAPASSTGLPYVRRDGNTNPERKDLDRYDAVRLNEFTKAVSRLALCYYLTDAPVYAEHAAILLRTWFIDPATRMNPNLDFGQGVPGKRKGSPGGIIDTVNLIEVTDAVRMLEGSPYWTKRDNTAIREWFSAYLEWLRTSPLGIKESNSPNNHAVWYDAQVAAFALFTHQADIAAKVAEAAKVRRIASQIESDGRMPLELSRTRPIHYSIYTAAAFITLARAGDLAGVNLWAFETTDSRSLKTMLTYLAPYLDSESQWDSEAGTRQWRTWFARYLAIAASRCPIDKYAEMASGSVDLHSKEDISIRSFKLNSQ